MKQTYLIFPICILLIILLCACGSERELSKSSENNSNSSESQIAHLYLNALKKESSSPIDSLFISMEFFLEKNANQVETDEKAYIFMKGLFYRRFPMNIRGIKKELEKKNIDLKRCKIISISRSMGINGTLAVRLQQKKKEFTLYINVVEHHGKDYLTFVAPSLKGEQNLMSIGETTIINSRKYNEWLPRVSEIDTAKTIIKEQLPIKLDSITVTQINWENTEIHGIINFLDLHLIVIELDSPKLFLFVDFEDKKYLRTESKAAPIPSHLIPSANSIDEKIALQALDSKIAESFLEVQHKNHLFITEVEQLRTEMIDSTGGYTISHGKEVPKGRKNNDITTYWLAYGERGKRLKASILENRQNLFSLIAPEDREEMKEKITLDIDEETAKSKGKTWAEFTFARMPMAAVLPLLSQMQANARGSELKLFKYLSKKYPRKE